MLKHGTILHDGQQMPMNESTLALIIVQPEDTELASRALIQAGMDVTRMEPTGGFLYAGNVTVLLGLEHSQVAHAIESLVTNCHAHAVFANVATQLIEVHPVGRVLPVEVVVGGATIFVVPVEDLARFDADPRFGAALGRFVLRWHKAGTFIYYGDC
jgi:uncharacterized protein YaaQ